MFLKVLRKEYEYNYGRRKLLILRAIKWYLKAPNYRVVVLLNYYQRVNSLLKKRIIANKLSIKYGVEVGTKPSVGKGLQIMHFQNLVIGNEVKIGNNVKLYQGVTLGEKNKGYPVIDDNVIVYPGAKVIGPIKIGKNAIIGANSVVLEDVPKNTIVAGIPAKIIKTVE